MTRSKLKRRYNLDKIMINFEKYKKQRNISVNLLCKSEKQYFNNIDIKNVAENKMFWKTIIPKFSNKCKTASTIILVEDDKNLTERKSYCKHFIVSHTDITHSLGLKKKNIGLQNTLSKIVKTFEKI